MSDNVKLNPLLQDVVLRTREAGLHKVASHLYKQPITLGDVIAKTGRDLLAHHHKFARVNDGLSALTDLESSGIVKLEKVAFSAALARLAQKGMGMVSKGWQGVGNMGARAGTAIAQRPVMNRMQQVDKAIAAMPNLSNAQRGAMTQRWLPAAEQAMSQAGARGAAMGKNVAQGAALMGAGAGLGYGMSGSGNNQ